MMQKDGYLILLENLMETFRMVSNDITKCEGYDCSLKATCLRFTLPADDWQSYFALRPYDEGKECEFYLKIPTKEIKNDVKCRTNAPLLHTEN